ncbi:MAG TPA: fructose PTS transporter subunit IIB [Candidatus Agrococcus pullicola]|uniref:Fructose PTS transporter subunit IIB n=1 Tax=Candidatus Agrococcus pullicola TaxID=2838429 RepID=A0A9D2CAA1_9MICO|nr:fructose PTS transporter subunit IIB [Candidatus Agrococcus pullicola]
MANIIGVSSCPAGIAHTYMAAESIEKAGKRLGHTVKMETQGAAGAENALSARDIENADVVVIAADVTVDEARFEGMRIVRVSVGEAIRGAESVIEKAVE